MNEKEQLINFGRQKLSMSPLPVGWLKFLIRVYPIILSVLSVAGIIMNCTTVYMALSEEIKQELSADRITIIIAVGSVCTALYLGILIYSIIMKMRMPMLTEGIRREIIVYIISSAITLFITETASNLSKVFAFPEKSNIESTLTYCGFVLIALAFFVIYSIRNIKKRSYIFLDYSYYEDELRKPSGKTKKKKHKKK